MKRRDFVKAASVLATISIVPRHVLGKGFLAPSDIINLGFIGTGKQSGGLMNSFLNTGEAQVLAACDVYALKLNDFLNKHKKFHSDKGTDPKQPCQPYTDFREVLTRKDIDAVVIVTPDHQHAAISVRAANAGKDIYCEKPLALTIPEGRAMVSAVRKNKRVFQTGSMQRSWPEFRQTAELIRNNYLGDLQTIKVSVGGPPVPFDLPAQQVPAGMNWDAWLGPNVTATPFNNDLAPKLEDTFWPKWRLYREFGGGGMTDWGAHMFDIVQWALDMDESGPTEIIPPDGKEIKFLTYKYANGLTMTHEDFGLNNAIRFIGSKGQLDVQRRKLVTTPESLATYIIGDDEKHVYRSENHYKDFLDAMRGRRNPICDVEVGHRTASVCTLGNLAYELRRPLTWDPIKEKFDGDKEANKQLSRPMRKGWDV